MGSVAFPRCALGLRRTTRGGFLGATCLSIATFRPRGDPPDAAACFDPARSGPLLVVAKAMGLVATGLVTGRPGRPGGAGSLHGYRTPPDGIGIAGRGPDEVSAHPGGRGVGAERSLPSERPGCPMEAAHPAMDRFTDPCGPVVPGHSGDSGVAPFDDRFRARASHSPPGGGGEGWEMVALVGSNAASGPSLDGGDLDRDEDGASPLSSGWEGEDASGHRADRRRLFADYGGGCGGGRCAGRGGVRREANRGGGSPESSRRGCSRRCRSSMVGSAGIAEPGRGVERRWGGGVESGARAASGGRARPGDRGRGRRVGLAGADHGFDRVGACPSVRLRSQSGRAVLLAGEPAARGGAGRPGCFSDAIGLLFPRIRVADRCGSLSDAGGRVGDSGLRFEGCDRGLGHLGLGHLDSLRMPSVPDCLEPWALRPPGAPRSEPNVGLLK